VINHVSEMGAYFYSFKIISQYGHVKVRKPSENLLKIFVKTFSMKNSNLAIRDLKFILFTK
jgi:hypothetical protein